ncbi:hypothetical protein GCM10009690_32270 [Brevibacterium permense]|uniref:Uncharacterized protein n=1 Tax=Brevibacterium permense TaxID=234834 RepID=A0ABN2AT28_9MICO
MIEFANMIRPAAERRTHRLRRPTGPAGPFASTVRFFFGMESIVPPAQPPSAWVQSARLMGPAGTAEHTSTSSLSTRAAGSIG